MAGRPPTPIEVHKARGTFNVTRHKGKAEVPDVEIGEAPEYFDAVMLAEWSRIGAIQHIKAAHRVAVEHACVLYSQFVQDAKGLEAMSASKRAAFHSVYMQLGLTPASQAKIPAAPAAKTDDPWAKLG